MQKPERFRAFSRRLHSRPCLTCFKKGQSAAHIKVTITNLLQILKIATVDQSTIEQALSLPYKDFENVVKMMAAVQSRVDYLVTRNARDFQPAPLTVLQPSDLLVLR